MVALAVVAVDVSLRVGSEVGAQMDAVVEAVLREGVARALSRDVDPHQPRRVPLPASRRHGTCYQSLYDVALCCG